MVDQYTRQRLIQAGIDPDAEVVDLDSVNEAASAPAAESYQKREKSLREDSPVSPDYDQQRTPWSEADRLMVY